MDTGGLESPVSDMGKSMDAGLGGGEPGFYVIPFPAGLGNETRMVS